MLNGSHPTEPGHPSRARRDGLEKLRLLRDDFGPWTEGEACYVSTGSPEALDEAVRDGLRHPPEHDGDRPGRSCSRDGRRRRIAPDDVDATTNELSRKLCEPLGPTLAVDAI